MLQTIRDKLSGRFAVVVLGLIILTMAFFGVESYFQRKVETFAAKIEGPARFLGFGAPHDEISQADFRRRFDQIRVQQRRSEGEAFDPQAFESVENKRKVLDGMVDEAVALMAARKDGVGVSKKAIQDAILEFDAFKVDGKFDPDRYRLALQSQRMTPQEFERLVREDLVRNAVSAEVAASALASDEELAAFAALSRQKRDLRWLSLPVPSLPAEVPSDADLAAWHQAHSKDYERPETVTIEYLELDAATMPAVTSVDESTLRQRYEEQKARYVTEPQYLTSHLLVAVPKNAPAAVEAAAREKANALAAQARTAGADFAELARQNSDDLGSKADGGDLGAISKGVFDPVFEKAVFALKAGEVSQPVRGAEGWHVIKVREVVPGATKPFEEVRAELEQEAIANENERAFSDLSGKLIDLVYKDPNTLAPAAKELGLPLLNSGPFTRSQGDGVAALEPIRKQAFKDEQRLQGLASGPVELGSNHIVVLRVTDHRPAVLPALAEVHERVLADFNRDRLHRLAEQQAQTLLEKVHAGAGLDALAAELARPLQVQAGVERHSNALPPGLLDEAFRLARPVAGKPGEVALAQLDPETYALVEVTAVADGDPKSLDEATRTALRTQLASARGAIEARTYLQALRKQYTITVAEDRL